MNMSLNKRIRRIAIIGTAVPSKKEDNYLIGSDKKEEETNKKNIYAQKHHDGDLLAEAIIVGRKPYFAVAAPKVGNSEQVSITLQDSIQIDETTILKPPELASCINKPYTFKSEQEFHELVENTRGKSLDGLFRKVKSNWEKYMMQTTSIYQSAQQIQFSRTFRIK